MTSHELANFLLAHQDLPVAVHVFGHTYSSVIDKFSHGPLQVGLANTPQGYHIVIGTMLNLANTGRFAVTEILTSVPGKP